MSPGRRPVWEEFKPGARPITMTPLLMRTSGNSEYSLSLKSSPKMPSGLIWLLIGSATSAIKHQDVIVGC